MPSHNNSALLRKVVRCAPASACRVRVSELRGGLPERGVSPDPRALLLLVLSGHVAWSNRGRARMFSPGTLCQLPPGFSPRMHFRDDVQGYAVSYPTWLLPAPLQKGLRQLDVIEIDLGSTLANQARALRGLFQELWSEQESRQEGWEFVMEARLVDLVVRVLRLAHRRREPNFPGYDSVNESSDRVARYVLHLQSHFSKQDTMAGAARSVALSPRRFGELFRLIAGKSWRRCVQDLRLRHAAALLVDTDKPVNVIAFESGFDDLSNFHHAFKAQHGCSPLAYRLRRRGRAPL